MTDKMFQRKGAKSNSHVGSEFESTAEKYFLGEKTQLARGYEVAVGVASSKKTRKFDLGTANPPTLVECKSHRWTEGGNVPSAKITVWNEAMYYFHLAPKKFRKVLFVLKDYSAKRDETLAAYYVRNYSHLIPVDVEILEFDESTGKVRVVCQKP